MHRTRHALVTWSLVLTHLLGSLGVLCDEGDAGQAWELIPCVCGVTSGDAGAGVAIIAASDLCADCEDIQVVVLKQGDDDRAALPPPTQIAGMPPCADAGSTARRPGRAPTIDAKGPHGPAEWVGCVVLLC